jgi:hypothetical protein
MAKQRAFTTMSAVLQLSSQLPVHSLSARCPKVQLTFAIPPTWLSGRRLGFTFPRINPWHKLRRRCLQRYASARLSLSAPRSFHIDRLSNDRTRLGRTDCHSLFPLVPPRQLHPLRIYQPQGDPRIPRRSHPPTLHIEHLALLRRPPFSKTHHITPLQAHFPH